jgi:hypothetical protein
MLVYAKHSEEVVLLIQIFIFKQPLGQETQCCSESKHVREPPDCTDHTETSDHHRQIKHGSYSQVTELKFVNLSTFEKLFILQHSLRKDSGSDKFIFSQANSMVVFLQGEVEESEWIKNGNKECPDDRFPTNPDQTDIADHHFSKERRVLNQVDDVLIFQRCDIVELFLFLIEFKLLVVNLLKSFVLVNFCPEATTLKAAVHAFLIALS